MLIDSIGRKAAAMWAVVAMVGMRNIARLRHNSGAR